MLILSAPSADSGSLPPATAVPAVSDPAKTARIPAAKKLTARQSFFVRLVGDGKSHSEAYRVAYCKPLLKAPAASVGAYRIASQPNVRAHLDAIHLDPPAALLTLQQRLEIIAGIIVSPNATRYERMRAAELYTKIAGDGAPELPPWDPDTGALAGGADQTDTGFSIRVDIFKNAPSRAKAVIPLQTRLQSTGVAPAVPAGNGNGNGNSHH